ncbi:hypothetical protein [Roseateles depolymerans]|uniref:Uncharacterized protein n=1 Tax=Roseateles depolymerans TaxID=76731 RepID=A0A0U3MDK0_9BURK|nr:hypothetical protein [Roseateles depolymerans]ALV06701.1 hypothetical protein RD2015_2229 [Roseateles depolymerans]REG19678.1 hypothetical protein DES44_2178 [Roseateles depolymerans]
MTLTELTLADAISVVGRMRDRDRECVRELVGEISDDDFAIDRYRSYGPAWALRDEAGMPWAIGGLTLVSGWTGVLWLVVADGLPLQSWRKLVRHTRTILVNAMDPLNEHGRRRVEAHVLASWPQAQALVAQVGMEHEGTRRAAGSTGADIQIWAKVREQQEN